jgi:tRNA-specific 2-thiouridylase
VVNGEKTWRQSHGGARRPLPDYAQDRFTVHPAHWIASAPATNALQTRVRHAPHLADCTVRPLGAERWEVRLAEKDQGIAPGQSAVFYEGEVCLGRGVIE